MSVVGRRLPRRDQGRPASPEQDGTASPEQDGTASPEQNGTASLELVIVAPVVLLLMMLIIAFGRFSQTESLVDQAARDAARAATAQNDKSEVNSIVQGVMEETLADAPSSCQDSAQAEPPTYHGHAFELADIAQATDIASVTITVTCQIDLGDLAALPLDEVEVSRTFTSPLDRYRGYQP